MATKPKETEETTPETVVDDTVRAQPPAPPVHTYEDKDGVERISVISEDPNWVPAPTTVTYPKAN